MKYIIQNLLSDEAADYHQALARLIAERFDIHFTYQQPPHFTLKYIFDTDRIDQIETLMKLFCASHRATPVKFGGFGGFAPAAVFIKVDLSAEARAVCRSFIKTLKTVKWMPWGQYDGASLHFHSTIAEHCNERYGEILQCLKGKERFFNIEFDNITLLKQAQTVNGINIWKVHQTFLLN